MSYKISEEEIKSKKYGRLTAIEKAGKSKNNEFLWRCKCDCGKETVVVQSRLRSGHTQSCGCLNREKVNATKEKKYNEIVGKRFGLLTVIERTNKKGGNAFLLKCKCDCGNETFVQRGHLTSGTTKSCGCLQGYNFKTHGDTGTRLHNIWRGFLSRCSNPNVKCYERYGGRGITVCDEWKGEHGFEHFKKWAITNGYRDDLTIDRKNVNGNYCPENCKWSTIKEQNNNKRKNIKLKYNGKEQTIAQWAEELGVSYSMLYSRIKKGWSVEKALITPNGGVR